MAVQGLIAWGQFDVTASGPVPVWTCTCGRKTPAHWDGYSWRFGVHFHPVKR